MMKNKLFILFLLFISEATSADESTKGYYIHPSQKEWHEKDLQSAQFQAHLIEQFVAKFLANRLDILYHHLPKDLPEGGLLSDLQMLEIKINSYQKTPLELLPENMRGHVKATIEHLDKKERHKPMYHPEKSNSGPVFADKERLERNMAFRTKFGCYWLTLEAAAREKISKEIITPLGEYLRKEKKGISEEYIANQIISALNEVSKLGVEQYLKKHPELRPSAPPSKK